MENREGRRMKEVNKKSTGGRSKVRGTEVYREIRR